MWLKSLGIFMLISLSIAQERVRLRRPRPIDEITNPDGNEEGQPIPLRRIPQGISVDQLVNSQQQDAGDLLAIALTSAVSEDDFRGQNLQSTDALQSLLATAAEGEDVIEEVLIEESPVVRPERPRRPSGGARPGRTGGGRTRLPPGIPQRQRPRDNEKKGQRLPNQTPARDNVDTIERYSHTNEDGSFTFGYIGEDGSFREETRGVDCITRGKYGYIDPDGKKREFTYVSGLPCDITGEEGELEDDETLQREDPINPNDRFRTSDPIQLDPAQIPESARPRQRPQQAQRQQPTNNDFSSFQQQQPRPAVTRVRDPALNNRRPRPGQTNTGALQSLLQIANGDQQQQQLAPLAPRQPVARPVAPPQPRRPVPPPQPRPVTPRPVAASPRPSAFDFDSEIQDFTLNKPAITFDDEPRPPTPVGPNFSTELVFDPASGTFKTELRQAIPGGEEVRTSNDAAPLVPVPKKEEPKPAPVPTLATQPPTARPFTAFSPTPTTLGPRPTQPATPTLIPLTFPSPVPTTPRPAPTSIAPASPSPSARPASPSPSTPRPASPSPTTPRAPGSPNPTQNSFFFQPFPTVGSPRPLPAGAPIPSARPVQVQPQARPAPTPNAARPAPTPARPAAPTQVRPAAGTPIPFNNGAFVTFAAQPGSPRPGTPQPQANFASPRPQVPQTFSPRPTPGQLQFGQPTPGQQVFGQPTPGQQVFGQPTPGQQVFGQPGRPFTVFGNPAAFRPQPQFQQVAAASPSPRPAPRPVTPGAAPEAPRQSANPTNAPRAPPPTPQAASPRPTPQAPSPTPLAARPSPTPQAARPPPTPQAVRPPPTPQPIRPQPTPQVQFGFQPIQTAAQPQAAGAPSPVVQTRPPQQVQTRPPVPSSPPRPGQSRPFTAFAGGLPPQLSGGSRPPPSQFQARPQTSFFAGARPQQFPQPPQGARPPQRPQTLGIPPQLQPQGGRFQPFNRPPPGAPQNRPSPFTVFNPAALRGARFF